MRHVRNSVFTCLVFSSCFLFLRITAAGSIFNKYSSQTLRRGVNSVNYVKPTGQPREPLPLEWGRSQHFITNDKGYRKIIKNYPSAQTDMKFSPYGRKIASTLWTSPINSFETEFGFPVPRTNFPQSDFIWPLFPSQFPQITMPKESQSTSQPIQLKSVQPQPQMKTPEEKMEFYEELGKKLLESYFKTIQQVVIPFLKKLFITQNDKNRCVTSKEFTENKGNDKTRSDRNKNSKDKYKNPSDSSDEGNYKSSEENQEESKSDQNKLNKESNGNKNSETDLHSDKQESNDGKQKSSNEHDKTKEVVDDKEDYGKGNKEDHKQTTTTERNVDNRRSLEKQLDTDLGLEIGPRTFWDEEKDFDEPIGPRTFWPESAVTLDQPENGFDLDETMPLGNRTSGVYLHNRKLYN